MIRGKTTIVTGVMFSILILPFVSSVVFAQYLATDGNTGLDDYLQLAQDRVTLANDPSLDGSGTPIFAANGVVGALLLSTGIFGGVAGTFFIKSRQGKYAAMGRG